MKTIQEIQSESGDLWPDIDEAINDVRRACAAELHQLHLSNAADINNLSLAHSKELEKRENLIAELVTQVSELSQFAPQVLAAKRAAIEEEILKKQQELESLTL